MNNLSVSKYGVVTLLIWLFVGLLPSADGAQYSLFVDELNMRSLSSGLEAVRPSNFKSIRRFRRVNLAPIVASGNYLVQGDVLTLNLFDSAAYSARIDRISTNINGTVSIRARIDDYPLGYVLISTTGNESLASISIPEKASLYCIQNNSGTGTHYLYEMNADGIEELQDSSPQIPPVNMSQAADEIKALGEQLTSGPLDQANIDVMIVYTPAAMSWAGGASGIANVIAQAMGKAQLALDNSGTFLTMTLTHSAQVDYTESGNSRTDLDRLTYTTDGYMDQIHSWRYTYKADLVALFAQVEDTGGSGWILRNPLGSPSYAFTLSRVQQVGDTYTLIHELGHNMGCDHRKDQAIEPGQGLFSYSEAWRWIGNDGGKYCSVMSYEEDGYSRVGYFSNPNILYQGVPTGDAANGDNARTIREIKHVVAAYRVPTGSLQVNLSPQGAIDAGAQWRRTGTSTWYSSGYTEQYISTGSHTVEFKDTPGWAKSANITVSIGGNQLTETAGIYTVAPEIIIGTGTSDWIYPLATNYHDVRTQIIYLANEIGGPRNLIALGLYITDTPGQVANGFTIRLKHIDLDVYGSSPNWESLDWTTVYQANEDMTEKTGWVQFYFTVPFVYNGIQNLMVDISFNNSSYNSPGYCRYSLPGGTRTIYYMSDSRNSDPLTWSGRSPIPSTSIRVPNIKLVNTALIGDLDGTVGVDWQDLALFVLHWLQTGCGDPNWCGGADFDKSSNVNLTDFAVLALHWLEGNVQYLPYDIVVDGKINVNDLLVLIEQWLDVPGTPSADIAPQPLDNFVDFQDFSLLAQHWLEGT